VEQATEDVQKGVTQEDIDVFYEVWSQFDVKATEYMPLDRLSEFVDRLDEPLRLPAPNTVKLITLDIAIYHVQPTPRQTSSDVRSQHPVDINTVSAQSRSRLSMAKLSASACLGADILVSVSISSVWSRSQSRSREFGLGLGSKVWSCLTSLHERQGVRQR